MRMPSLTSAGSSSAPFKVTERTVLVIASMNVVAPGVPSNRTVVREPNTSGPRVRSSCTA